MYLQPIYIHSQFSKTFGIYTSNTTKNTVEMLKNDISKSQSITFLLLDCMSISRSNCSNVITNSLDVMNSQYCAYNKLFQCFTVINPNYFKQFFGSFELSKTGTTVLTDSYMNEDRYIWWATYHCP